MADELLAVVAETLPRLRGISEAESLTTRGPGTWSRREILGHLIDSAGNNHQRFVRAQIQDALAFPGYEQEAWVTVQRYKDRPWPALVGLWSALNEHLAHVIARIPGERLGTQCTIGGGGQVDLEFIVRDYVKHLRHHLAQILEPKESLGRAHPPYP